MRISYSLIVLFIGIFLFSNDAKSQLSIDTDITILEAQSDEGNSDAKFYLGTLYYIGRGMIMTVPMKPIEEEKEKEKVKEDG